MAWCPTGIFRAVFRPVEIGSAVSLLVRSDPATCCLTVIFPVVFHLVETGSASLVSGSRWDLMRDSIPISNPNLTHLDSGNYIVRVSVEPVESVSLLPQLVPPPVSEQESTLVIAVELASLHRQPVSAFRQQRKPLAPTFSDLVANSIAPIASSPAELVPPAFSLVHLILLLEAN